MRLADASGETINLAVPGPDGVEHLAQEDTAHFVGRHRLGRPSRALRARRERQVLPRLRRRRGDRGCRPIRSRGYATSIDELEVGLSALAAPVLGADGVAVAALSISGPTSRLTAARIEELAPLLQERSHGRSPDDARCRMTHEEILQGLYDNTLVGNAPEVKDLVERAGSRTGSIRSRCCTTR